MYTNQNRKIEYRDLGLMRYQEAWDYQTSIFDGVVADKVANRKREQGGEETLPTQNYLLFCEHPHVYTLGKSGSEEHLLIDTLGLKNKEAEFFKINRGGDITYHGPGQVVVYPIMDLDNFFTDIHKYLRFIEETVILTLADYGIQAGRVDGLTGVWIVGGTPNPRKICAIGVKASRWVTMHGFAFNVNADLDYFGNIVPCGISDKAVTSMEKELGEKINMEDVKAKLKQHFAELFEAEIV